MGRIHEVNPLSTRTWVVVAPAPVKQARKAELRVRQSHDKIAAQNRQGWWCPRVENRDEWGSLGVNRGILPLIN